MKWEVKQPPHMTPLMEATLRAIAHVDRVYGWTKREHGAYLFNVSGEGSHPGREVVVGPRGALHSDTQVDFEHKKAQREKTRVASPVRDPYVYSKDGRLIGFRLW